MAVDSSSMPGSSSDRTPPNPQDCRRCIERPGEILRLLNPACATDPEPTSGGKRLLLGLYSGKQGHLLIIEVLQAAETFQIFHQPGSSSHSHRWCCGFGSNRTQGWQRVPSLGWRRNRRSLQERIPQDLE